MNNTLEMAAEAEGLFKGDFVTAEPSYTILLRISLSRQRSLNASNRKGSTLSMLKEEIKKIQEDSTFHTPTSPSRLGRVAEDFDGELPLVTFTELHAITADHITRNKTFYPTQSLIGDPGNDSGFRSFTSPYPVPIIRDHILGPGFLGGLSSEPYGRIYHTSFISEQNSKSWVRAVAAITDPDAIAKVLTERYLTVSIGGEVDQVYCSVCCAEGKKINMVDDGLCEHIKGQDYDGISCYWIMGPLWAHEISFVNAPSDANARVINPNMDIHEVRTLLAGSDGEFLVDASTGMHESTESCLVGRLGISRRTYNQILKEAKTQRERYKDLLPKRSFLKALSSPDFHKRLKGP